MSVFLNRDRFGQPQFVAGVLLLIFFAQCVWLARRAVRGSDGDRDQDIRIAEGMRQWHRQGIAGTSMPDAFHSPSPPVVADGGDHDHSPLWYLVASAPVALWPGPRPIPAVWVSWLARIPYLAFGLLLGASLWYVARRLFGNQGGYIALSLYCFSPGVLRATAVWFAQPEVGAAWGAFGAVFTAIAVAHTLYAPREVVLWNWRRIALLGLSLALAVGSQFSLWVLIPLALAFLLYLAPARRPAALVIWMSACAAATVLLLAAYSLRFGVFWQGMRQANFFAVAWPAFAMPAAYHHVLLQLGQSCPALVLALPASLAVFCAWPRTHYFGNLAPLLVACGCLLLAVGTPHYPGLGFQFIALPFFFVFIAGVFADLLETKLRTVAMASIWTLLAAQALWNVWRLA